MSEMIDLVVDDASSKMEGAVAHARREMATIRTGRANSSFVEKLQVEVYGVPMTLQELATFAVPEARQLVITPHDIANTEAIERAVRNSELGLNPASDGRTLRISFPALTEERRKDLVKVINGMAEDGKGKIRGFRRAARKDLDDVDGVGEDDIERAEKTLDELTKSHEVAIDDARETKEQELLEV